MKESESVGAERAFIGTTFALAENCAFEYNILTISLKCAYLEHCVHKKVSERRLQCADKGAPAHL